MKKGVINYSITYKKQDKSGNYKQIEEVYFLKKTALLRYLNILDGENVFPHFGENSICELKIWEIYRSNTKPAENITAKVNKFLTI